MNERERHLIEYTILFTGFGLIVGLFYYFRYDKSALIYISGLGSIFYSLWGIIHHAFENRLTKSIAFEYFLISALVFILLLTVLSF